MKHIDEMSLIECLGEIANLYADLECTCDCFPEVSCESYAIEQAEKCKKHGNYYNCIERLMYQRVRTALEKQIPKKPKRLHNSEDYSPKCICCDKYIPTYNAMRKMKHCPHCGQAIDWGD